MNKSFLSVKNHLRASGITEGLSYLVLLFIAMPLKYFADSPAAVRYIGMLHGILFIWYVLSVFRAKMLKRISFQEAFWSLLASIIPFGTFYADRKIFRDMDEVIRFQDES